ncbi:MAG: adenylate/guanylate cyclase domain-containing protein [Candidatus Rokuibacteriota bacterium]
MDTPPVKLLPDGSRTAVATTERQLGLLLIVGNLLGALLDFFYFQFIDLSSPPVEQRLRGGVVAYFVIVFAVAVGIGFLLNRRWRQPLLDWAREGARAHVAEALVRRRALLLPYAMAAVSLAGWTLAGVAWGVVWPWLLGNFSIERALRQIFGITVVGGSVTTAFVFFSVEHVWRRRLPLYFPRGDLSATRDVARVNVRTRLMVIFLLVSVLPLSLLGVICYTWAGALVGADPALADTLLGRLLVFIVFMLLVGGLVAVGLAVFVSRSVAGPLRDLEAAMQEVGQGNLQIRCPVVSHDEIGSVTEGFNRMVEGLRERERIRDTFGKYVTPEVRDEILAGRVVLEGQAREVTILFADLRDFTPWVEARDPREVVRDLNTYFGLMEGAIRDHHGLVLQFIGDEIEAVFGAPISHARHPDQAVGAALEMRRRLAAWNAERMDGGRPLFRHGIGVHTGRVLAANIGSPDRLSYALVGDPVNVASRIQGLTKEVGTDILVSADTAQRLLAPPPLTAVAAMTMKGKSTAVDLYRVI